MGPFTQEDPIGIAGGLNLYGYANGDPINFSDPFGLSASCEPLCTAVDVGFLMADIRDIRENGLGLGNAIGVGLGIIAVATPFVTGLGAADDVVRTASKYSDITKPRARMWNRATDVGAVDFGDNLVSSGFTRTTRDDGIQVFTQENRKYVVRGPERSNHGWTADVYVDDKVVGKIRLGGGG